MRSHALFLAVGLASCGGNANNTTELVNYLRSISATGTASASSPTARTTTTSGMDFIAKWCYVAPWTAP